MLKEFIQLLKNIKKEKAFNKKLYINMDINKMKKKYNIIKKDNGYYINGIKVIKIIEHYASKKINLSYKKLENTYEIV